MFLFICAGINNKKNHRQGLKIYFCVYATQMYNIDVYIFFRYLNISVFVLGL